MFLKKIFSSKNNLLTDKTDDLNLNEGLVTDLSSVSTCCWRFFLDVIPSSRSSCSIVECPL